MTGATTTKDRAKRACVIGAGSAGLTAVKALKDARIDFDCYEMSDHVGGLWHFDPDPNGRSAAYRGLNSNAPKPLMQYAEFPMAEKLPGFPSHWDFGRYFEDYAKHFGLLEHIRFNTAVERVEPRADGAFDVQLADGTVERYTDVLVANGHHWNPKWPDFPGTFDGVAMHSHSYRDATFAVDKRVVVVGMGNSAMDIAVEVSDVARRAYLSARSGVHLVPKQIFGGKPDKHGLLALSYKPVRMITGAFVRWYQGSPESYGLPKPTHAFGDTHPTGSGRIVDRLAHGRVLPKPNISELRGDRVLFADGSEEEIDILIYCTGYWISFPFFDEDYISAPQNAIRPFLKVALPDRPGVWFIGLCQPIGAIQPLAEAQSRWVADILAGRASLPSVGEMRAAIERERRSDARRWVHSTRNTIEVDHLKYMRRLRREHKAGLKRGGGSVSSGAPSSAVSLARTA